MHFHYWVITITSRHLFTVLFIVLLLPAFAFADESCPSAFAHGRLDAILTGGAAMVTNTGADAQTVSIVTYKMFAPTIDDQQLFDSKTVTVEPSAHRRESTLAAVRDTRANFASMPWLKAPPCTAR